MYFNVVCIHGGKDLTDGRKKIYLYIKLVSLILVSPFFIFR